MKPNIAILDDYLGISQEVADWGGLKSRANVVVFDRPLALPDEAARELAGFDIICTLRERMPIPGELINRLPRLKYIVVTGKRYDTVDIATAASRGVLVSNTPVSGAGAGGVAELVWGLILSATRHIASEDRSMRRGGWQTQAGTTVGGKVLGILGLGSLGRRVAEIGKVFGMELQAWSQNMTAEQAEAAGARLVSKQELFATSDVVTIHLALSDRTRGIVGATDLQAMKKTAYIINTARGAIVDEPALIAALRSRSIAGAGLDVYEKEPLPVDHPFRSLSNVVITPHLGYFTRDMLGTYYGDAVRLIEAFLDGRPERVVNMGLDTGC
ncbi:MULTISPECIES: D-2-hydroxyacid dehydrogenase family protein [Rhizobium]|uniref:D-2-hydroxyacid dehydrogenase family protein n=1 Tax=Rhizobium indicum TaxID=2583231 RepID=A0ABX6PBP9_9HYPH|nr:MULTISPECIES: D-2-hydroxyacid dehydrogenase family protein [Rhizobium]NYT30077.1 D-2-hydroxyacid dehydrogenase family protein [Rhizobium sp. WYCCWR 11128]QKK15345.1 D-2-hydroxyacid dehydrogenase family protein [Rhizobium indicum]QKK28866.1 D-2-hydroxyacid dehydrogenase family protein [Rhizobium indicum]